MNITGNANPTVVKTAIDEVFDQKFRYETQPGIALATNGMVFNQDSTDRAAVLVENFMGPSYFESTGEDEEVKRDTITVGDRKTINVAKYAKTLMISKDFFDDDLHSTVQKSIRDMGRKARLTRDKNAFDVYNNAFTTTLTGSGVALVSDSQSTLNGDTVDNKLTSALSPSALDSAITMLLEQKDQRGELGGHVASLLLVAPANMKTAIEITESERASGTSDNDINYFSKIYPGLVVMQSPYLGTTHGGTDANWFLLSEDHSVMRYEREALNTHLIDWTYDDAHRYKYTGRFREVIDAVSFEGLVGSIPA